MKGPAARFDLSGRVAFVTGASRGLGRRFAEVLAEAGASVALAARSGEALREAADAIGSAGGRAFPVTLDITDGAAVAAALDVASAEFGVPDILVNNAGIVRPAPSLETSDGDFDAVLATNLRAPFVAAREAARRMVAAGKEGAIVNVASMLASLVVGTELSSYGAAKAGLVQLTRTLAVEYARHGIRVNALAPGYVLTDMNRELLESPAGEKMVRRIPLRRHGDREDLDGALLLLCSPASAFMTGSVITVDGGQSLL